MSLASAMPDGLQGGVRPRAIFAVSLSVLLSVLDYAVANVALPTIGRDIHASAASSIWVVNAYQLASVVSLLPLAALGDRLGPAKVCRFGLGLFVVASVLCAISATLPELACGRALQGFGGACVLSVNGSLLRLIYPAARLGRGIAFNGAVIGMAVGLGPSVASGVLAVANWPWLFLINLPLGGAALLASVSLPRTPPKTGGFDGLNAILLVIGLGTLLIGGDSVAHRSSLPLSLSFMAAGGAGLVLLIRRQLGHAEPMLPVDLLARPAFRIAFISGLMSFIASNFFIISMPFTLQGMLHRSSVVTGLLMTPWPLGVVLASPFAGRLADRYPAAVLTCLGICLTGCGFLALRLLPPRPGDFDILWRIGIAGFGFGLFQPPNNRAMLLAVPVARTSGASGMVSVARLLGQTLGAMLVAMLFASAAKASLLCLTCASAAAFFTAMISASGFFRK